MGELDQVRKSIYESEAIIKSNENLVGMGVWNIGNELKVIRDNKSYEEKGYKGFKEYAENELKYSTRHCYSFISIAENYGVNSGSQISSLGIKKLLALGQLNEEERETFIEENPVEDMTTKELQQTIKEKRELEQKIIDLENAPPKTVEVPPEDYQHYKDTAEQLKKTVVGLKRNLEDNNLQMEGMQKEKGLLERKVKLNEDESKKYNQLKTQIENLSKEKDDLGRQIKARTELSGLVVRVEHILKTELAPIKYSRAIREAQTDEIVSNNLRDIVDRVQDWCNEMNKYTSNKNIINLEVVQYD